MKKSEPCVCVEKTMYSTNFPDYLPVTFAIEVEESGTISGISETTAKTIYEKLGVFFSQQLS